MIGPSSPHTAGAAGIGFIARAFLEDKPVKAKMLLHGSFAKIYKGHGTDTAIVAGIESAIPADEVIWAIKKVSDMMPTALKETAEGGLAATPPERSFTVRCSALRKMRAVIPAPPVSNRMEPHLFFDFWEHYGLSIFCMI